MKKTLMEILSRNRELLIKEIKKHKLDKKNEEELITKVNHRCNVLDNEIKIWNTKWL